MSGDVGVDYWALDRDLRALVDSLASYLFPEEPGHVIHLVDVHEYGLAMEDLVDILSTKRLSLDKHAYDRLQRVADCMGMGEAASRLRPDRGST